MHRLQLMEIEDQSWCPAAVRDGATDFLQTMMTLTDPYAPVRPLLIEALKRCGARRIIDLCAGGGGPWRRFLPTLQQNLGQPPQLWLTDLYPNPQACRELQRQYPQQVVCWPEPVDALRPPEQLRGFYTLFTAAHHFRPEALGRILRQAVEKGQGIALFELAHRSLPALLLTLLTPLAVLLLIPFCRPFRLSRLFWTYLIPLVPVLALFDGIVSCLRSYTPEELRGIVARLGANDYRWQIGEQPSDRGLTPLTYLIGTPRGNRPGVRRDPRLRRRHRLRTVVPVRLTGGRWCRETASLPTQDPGFDLTLLPNPCNIIRLGVTLPGCSVLPRKKIVKNIAPCDASQNFFPYRVAPGSDVPAAPGCGSLCPLQNQITSIPGRCRLQTTISSHRSLSALSPGFHQARLALRPGSKPSSRVAKRLTIRRINVKRSKNCRQEPVQDFRPIAEKSAEPA